MSNFQPLTLEEILKIKVADTVLVQVNNIPELKDAVFPLEVLEVDKEDDCRTLKLKLSQELISALPKKIKEEFAIHENSCSSAWTSRLEKMEECNRESDILLIPVKYREFKIGDKVYVLRAGNEGYTITAIDESPNEFSYKLFTFERSDGSFFNSDFKLDGRKENWDVVPNILLATEENAKALKQLCGRSFEDPLAKQKEAELKLIEKLENGQILCLISYSGKKPQHINELSLDYDSEYKDCITLVGKLHKDILARGEGIVANINSTGLSFKNQIKFILPVALNETGNIIYL